MNKTYFSLLLLIICLFLATTSCDKEETTKELPPVSLSKISGLAEKGPFINGSSVKVYELDQNLNGTGRVFEAKTNDLGAFSIETSVELVSPYVKLSVNGFYYNEYSGKLSDAPIELEGIVYLDKQQTFNMNINLLTHLEMPRVMNLIKSEKKSFADAKKQAEKELLAAFLITDKTVIPENIDITSNNTSSNILIAISSILLNERSDAEFSEFVNSLRNDLSEGKLSENNKQKIASSSLGLSYSNIKSNIKDRYQELGKDVEVGDFELFIDGNGDGKIGDHYDEKPTSEISDDSFFKDEKSVQLLMTGLAESLFKSVQYQYLFDAAYTNSLLKNQLLDSELISIYDHNLTSNNRFVNNMWSEPYKCIYISNKVIEGTESIKADWIRKYRYTAKTFRAYEYYNMINLWGDVPLVTSTQSNDWYPPRRSKDEILNLIIQDLEESIRYLPEESALFYCSKNLAMSLLSKAYLEKKEYDQALKYTNTIIDSGKFALSSDYNAIFSKGNREAIFELPNNDEYAIQDYVKLIKKGTYFSLARYAEVILIASEANYNKGNVAKAFELLNQVRARNGKGALNTSSDFKNELLNEWQRDFKNEGLYFFALKRWNAAIDRLGISTTGLLLPIPINEIDFNPTMVQNPGY